MKTTAAARVRRRGSAAALLLCLAVMVNGAQSTSNDDRFHGPIRRILQIYDAHGEAAALDQARLLGTAVRFRAGNSVIPLIIDPIPGVFGASFDRGWLESRGIMVDAVSRSYVRVLVPIGRAREVAGHPQAAQIETPARPMPVSCSYGLGSYVSEGVYRTNADSFQAHNINGSGAKIAIVDLGFINLDSAIARGELPANTIKIHLPGAYDSSLNAVTVHGVATSETTMDMAPGASLYCIMVSDQIDMENARDTLKARGIRIANHSVAWFGDGYYTDSRGNRPDRRQFA